MVQHQVYRTIPEHTSIPINLIFPMATQQGENNPHRALATHLKAGEYSVLQPTRRQMRRPGIDRPVQRICQWGRAREAVYLYYNRYALQVMSCFLLFHFVTQVSDEQICTADATSKAKAKQAAAGKALEILEEKGQWL